MKLIGVGDNVVDYYKDQNKIYPGGNAVNVAVLSKRYGTTQNSYIGIVGNDAAGEHVANSLQAEGIDISRIRKAYGPNWESIISLNDEADRIFVGSNKGGVQASFKLNFSEADISYIASHDLMHTSLYSYIEKEVPELSKHIAISFDFSLRREEEYLELLCPYLQYAFFSGSDLSRQQCIELLHHVHRLGTEVVGITRGAEGALFLINGEVHEQAIVKKDGVIDTLGAGDSFIAMFLTQYHQNHNAEEALQQAAEAAAETCGIYGAFGYGVSKGSLLSC
ncbi:PfkB family carbohydrate kinase [Bacillus sp. OTU530]|uniref:PfkB family carbohydrate kinase n=1 Tax=Bacillus sp. OTU530 TaxID=3043862 RepID=UPI00313D95BE